MAAAANPVKYRVSLSAKVLPPDVWPGCEREGRYRRIADHRSVGQSADDLGYFAFSCASEYGATVCKDRWTIAKDVLGQIRRKWIVVRARPVGVQVGSLRAPAECHDVDIGNGATAVKVGAIVDELPVQIAEPFPT